MADHIGNQVVAAIDTLLAEQPDKVGHDFSDAVRLLCAWRDELRNRWRTTQEHVDRDRLDRVNAALSVVVGGQFPIGPVPWPHIRRSREELVALAQQD